MLDTEQTEPDRWEKHRTPLVLCLLAAAFTLGATFLPGTYRGHNEDFAWFLFVITSLVLLPLTLVLRLMGFDSFGSVAVGVCAATLLNAGLVYLAVAIWQPFYARKKKEMLDRAEGKDVER